GRSRIRESFFVAPVADRLRYGCFAPLISTDCAAGASAAATEASASAARSAGQQARAAAAEIAARRKVRVDMRAPEGLIGKSRAWRGPARERGASRAVRKN